MENFLDTDDDSSESLLCFYAEDIEFELKNREQIAGWITKSAEAEGKAIGDISFIFCSDSYLHQMNVEFLQHDTLTDVITFPYSKKKDSFISGDIFISVERTIENAATFNISPEHELNRVMIHGILHLLGYGDKTAAKKKVMTEKEDFYLSTLSNS
jgi:probable rRNA maturation factor